MEISTEMIKDNFNCREVLFAPKKIITDSSYDDNEEFGVILDGTVLVESLDENGTRHVLDVYTKNDIFWKKAVNTSREKGYYMIAQKKSRIGFLEVKKNADKKLLVGFFSELNLDMHTRLISHVHILEQRTLRGKIFAFMKYYKEKENRNPFTLAVTLTDCADYLAVDRSAMMREIGRMEKEGIIRHKGRMFKIL